MAIKFNHTGAGDITLSSDAAVTLKIDGNKVWHEGNDGASSLLDSDKLDGQEGSYYLNLGNATGTLAADKGGTGIGSYTIGNYINAATATTLQQRTPAQVLSDIGAYAASNPSGYTSNTGTVTSVAAGNGMNFTTITGTGTVTLGTPSTVTAATTNSVSATTHTHAVTGFLPLTGGTISGDLYVGNGAVLLRGSDGFIYPVTDNSCQIGGTGNRFAAIHGINIHATGAGSGMWVGPRDGTGSTYAFYNPTGDQLRLYDSGSGTDMFMFYNNRMEILGAGYTTSPTGTTIGLYNATTGYIQTPGGASGVIDIWDNATAAIARFAAGAISLNKETSVTGPINITNAANQLRLYESDAADPSDYGLAEVNGNALQLYAYDNSAATWRRFLSGNVTTGALTLSEASYTTTVAGPLSVSAKLTTVATALAGAGLNLPHGTAPSAPSNGDVWTTTAGLYARINGSTVGPFGTGGGGNLDSLSDVVITAAATGDYLRYNGTNWVDNAGVPAADVQSGNLGSGVLPYATASATATNFKVPFLNTSGTTSGNYGLLHESGTTFHYNPSTDTLTAGTFSGSGASLSALNASNLSSGTVPTARLGSGTASSATFLRGDQTWAAATTFSGARAKRTTTQTITNNSSALITWTTEDYDTDGYFTASSTTFSIPADGYYLVICSIAWEANSSGTRGLALQKNTTQIARDTCYTGNAFEQGNCCSTVVYLTTTDTVAARAYVDSGGANRNITPVGDNTFMSILRVG